MIPPESSVVALKAVSPAMKLWAAASLAAKRATIAKRNSTSTGRNRIFAAIDGQSSQEKSAR